jgi:hypothetical protein
LKLLGGEIAQVGGKLNPVEQRCPRRH